MLQENNYFIQMTQNSICTFCKFLNFEKV